MSMPGFASDAALYAGSASGSIARLNSQGPIGDIIGGISIWWCRGGCLWDYTWCRISGGPASYCDFHFSYCLWSCRNPTRGPVIL